MSNNNDGQRQNQQRNPYLFFFPNFLNFSRNRNANNPNNNTENNNDNEENHEEIHEVINEEIHENIHEDIDENIDEDIDEDIDEEIDEEINEGIEEINEEFHDATSEPTLNTRRITPFGIDRPFNRMERLSNEPPFDNSNRNVINNELRHGSNVSLFTREPYERNISNISRNESYGFLSSTDSLIVDEILNDPVSSNEDLDSSEDGSTQSLVEMLDHIHRINLLSRAIEEERIRQREIERELERQAERERLRQIFMNEQHELSNFVDLLNTMMFLLSAERQLRRPFIGSFRRTSNISFPSSNSTLVGGENDEEGENEHEEVTERNETTERNRIPSIQQPGIHYVRPNPHPIITTPFMYARFEPERPGDNSENSNESIDRPNNNINNNNNNNNREGPTTNRPGNVMFFNVPLSFDLTNLIQLLSASTPHKRPGASKEAIETGTRILTPKMLKFGTRLQSQPNCIICQEDFIKNVNKRLKLKSKLHLNSKVEPESDDIKEKKEMEVKSDEGENNTKDIDEEKEEKEVNTDDDNIRLMPCGHIYHESCIFQWLKDNNTCPVCRYELETDDEEYNKGVYKRMGERGIDIPTFNIDFTFFCALEKCGQCKVISNLHKRRLENRGLTKYNSIENLVSHAITNVNASSMRYTRLPCCNHEFHWPCLKEALLKAGYHWEDEETNHKDNFFIPINKKFHVKKSLVNKKPNENDIIITDLEEEEEEPEIDEEIDYSIQSTSRRRPTPTVKKDEAEEWIDIKCPVCTKINKIPMKALKSKEQNKPTIMSRSKSMTILPKSLSIEKLEVKKLTTYNSLFNSDELI